MAHNLNITDMFLFGFALFFSMIDGFCFPLQLANSTNLGICTYTIRSNDGCPFTHIGSGIDILTMKCGSSLEYGLPQGIDGTDATDGATKLANALLPFNITPICNYISGIQYNYWCSNKYGATPINWIQAICTFTMPPPDYNGTFAPTDPNATLTPTDPNATEPVVVFGPVVEVCSGSKLRITTGMIIIILFAFLL